MLAYLSFLYNSFEKMLFQLIDDDEDYYVSGDVETDEEDITNVGECDSEQTTIADTDSEMEMEVSGAELERDDQLEQEPEDNYCYVRKLIIHDDESLDEEFVKVEKDSINPSNVKPILENLPKMHSRQLVQRKIVYGDDGETIWHEEEEEVIIENSPNNSDNTDDNLNNNSAVSTNGFESNAVYNDNELRKRNTQIIDSMV
jgi:hypothetical protein